MVTLRLAQLPAPSPYVYALVVDDAGAEQQAVLVVDAVGEVDAALVLFAAGHDVEERRRVRGVQLVHQRVDETERLTRELIGDRDDTGQQR
jgi:hypothetical protein